MIRKGPDVLIERQATGNHFQVTLGIHNECVYLQFVADDACILKQC